MHCPSTTCKYSSKLARLRTPCSLDRDLQLFHQTRSIMASKVARSLPLSVSANRFDYGLQSPSIAASKYISKLVQLRSPQVHLQTRSKTPSTCTSPNALNHDLAVHHYVHSITASKCITKFARFAPPGASPKSLEHRLGVYLRVHSIVMFRPTRQCSQA